MTCEERRDQMLLFAAGALEPAEETEMRMHLATNCAACAGALAEAEAVIQQIPLGLPLKKAPESAWESLETRVALREQMEQQERMQLMQPVMAATGAGESAATGAEAQGGSLFRMAGWAVAAGLVVVLGLTLFYAARQVSEQRGQIERLSNLATAAEALQVKVADLSRRLEETSNDSRVLIATLEGEARDRQSKVDALLRSEQYAVAPAEGVQQPEVKGRIFMDRVENQMVLFATNVQAPPAGETYVLWIVTGDGKKINAGAAKPDEKGNLMMEAKVPADAGTVAAAAVTDETNPTIASAEGKLQFLGSMAKQ